MHPPSPLLKKRRRLERIFRASGLGMVLLALSIVSFLLGSILKNGYTAFVQTQMKITVQVPSPFEKISPEALLYQSLARNFPFLKTPEAVEELFFLVSWGAQKVLKEKLASRKLRPGSSFFLWVPMGDEADGFYKAYKGLIAYEPARLTPLQQEILHSLSYFKLLSLRFNVYFLTAGDSQEPELAGLRGAFMGSIYTLFMAFLLAFPLGVGAGIYLEEFAPRNRWTDGIELHLNNLAAVPSIIFGLLGFVLFDQIVGLPRPSSLLGGMTLGLIVCPTLIVVVRLSLRAIPFSLRDAARALGASPLQVVFHQILPAAFPNILTGTMVALARALGESAPLLMVGMAAFIADVPRKITDPATVLPIQIFSWAKSSELGFFEKTSGAILGLLFFLILMNAVAVFLRQRLIRPLS